VSTKRNLVLVATVAAVLVLAFVASTGLRSGNQVGLSPSPSSTAAPSTTTPTASPLPAPTAPGVVGSTCTSPQSTTRAVVERYFALSGSGNVTAVRDCFAAAMKRTPDFDTSTVAWAAPSGTVTSFEIASTDTARGCDRYPVNWRTESAAFGAAFVVGPESGTPRIFEITQQLLRPELATTTCQ
jgi:hypothetical protein